MHLLGPGICYLQFSTCVFLAVCLRDRVFAVKLSPLGLSSLLSFANYFLLSLRPCLTLRNPLFNPACNS